MTQLVQAIVSGLALGAVFAVIGIGFVVINRVTGVVNFAQGAFAVLGAYLMSSAVAHLPWAAAVLVSALVTALVAAAVGLLVVTADIRLGFAPILVTLGVAIGAQGVFILVWGDLPVTYEPVSGTALRFLGAFVLPQQLLLMGAVLVLLVLLQLFFSHSYLGKALTAAALNRRSAQLVGVNLVVMGAVAFAVSGFVVGLSGSLFGALVPVTPGAHLALAVAGFAAAVAGNLYSPAGALAGGLVLGQIESFAATYGLPQYQQVFALVVLVLVLLARTLWQRRGGVLT